MKNKLWKIILPLTVLILLLIVSIPAGAEDTTATATVGSVTASPGDTVTVYVTVKNFNQIVSGAVDFSSLISEDVEIDSAKWYVSGTFLANFDSDYMGAFAYQNPTDIPDGNLCSITFKIKDTAKAGTITLNFPIYSKEANVTNISGTLTIKCRTHVYTDTVTAPTCTAKGYTTHVCERCGDTYVDSYTDKTSHTEVTVPGKAATCTEPGLTDGKKCSVCETVTVKQTEIPAKGHTEVTVPGKAATCTEPGLTDGKKCSVCETVTVQQTEITAKGHTESDWIVDKDATCSEEGIKHTECTVCKTTIQTGTIDKKNHTEVEVPGKAATCTDSGLTAGTKCSECETILKEQTTIPATGHDYEHSVTSPTCSARGYTTHTCANCGDTYVDTYTDMIAHTEVTLPEKAPTCTDTGLTEGKQCTVCKTITIPQNTIPATGHTYDDDEDDTCNTCGYVRKIGCSHEKTEVIPGKAATCTEAGLTEGLKCTECGDIIVTQKTIEATGHHYVDTVTPPTCTENGYTTHTCDKCQHSYVDSETLRTGHSFSEEWSGDDENHWHECSCGEKKDCSAHEWNDGEITKPATDSEDGEKTFTCIGCGMTRTEKIASTGVSDPLDSITENPTSIGIIVIVIILIFLLLVFF